MKRLCLLLTSLFVTSFALGATYTLPAVNTTTGAFAGCTIFSNVVDCNSSDLVLGNNDDIVLTQNTILRIGTNLRAGNNLTINAAGSFSLIIQVGGIVDIGNGADVTADLTAGATIDFGTNTVYVGDVTAGSTLNFGNGSGVTGNCSGSNPTQYNPYCGAGSPVPIGGTCFAFESGIPAGWVTAGNGQSGTSNQTSASGDSLYLRNRAVTVTTSDFNLAAETEVEYTVWVRRGDDSFSENPDNNEDLQLEYRDASGSWQILADYPGNGTEGEILTPTFTLTGAQLHNSFALRFNKTGGNNGDFDYWHIDDVCLTPAISIPTPVIDYRFDELSWSGAAGEVEDSSGNGLNATADSASATTTSNDAVICEAADLNGAGKHILAPDLSALEDTATLSFWIKTTQTGNGINWSSPGVAGLEASGTNNDIFWGWINENGQIGMTNGDDADGHTTGSNSVINDDIYHHVVLVYDNAANTASFYIDGAFNRTVTTGNNSIVRAFNTIGYFERTNGSTPNYLNALLDEFLVFDQILSSAQINEIYTLQTNGRNLDGTTRVCNIAPGSLNPLAWFTLDELNSGQYADDSGNNYAIDTVGSAVPIDASLGRICAANTIGDNNSSAEIDGLETDISFGLGGDVNETGAVSFWYNSNTDWDAFARTRILWDASSSDDFFSLQLDTSGRLTFAFEDGDSTDFRFRTNALNFNANDWHHISVSWDLPNQSVIFYIDGATAASTQINGNWADYDPLRALNVLLFGDGRSGDSDGGVNQSANGRFDELYVFDTALNSAEALAVFSETHPCPIQPLSYHQFEESVWTGATGEVLDETSNGLDLTNQGNNANLTAGRLCTGAFFDGALGIISRSNDPTVDDYSAGAAATFWMNPTAYPSVSDGDAILVAKTGILALSFTNLGQIEVIYFDATNTRKTFVVPSTLSLNSWYHISASVDSVSEKVWIDGNLVHDQVNPDGLMSASTGTFKIGAQNNVGVRQYSGRIDEMRWYRSSITQTEVTRDLLATHSCDTSLVGWYQLEEASYNGTNGEVIDYSGNRNNGVSEGATARATGYQCFGVTIPQNNSQAIREGIQTGVDLDSDLGDRGTIMLWYNSAEDWDTGRNRVLIDASTDTTDPTSGDNKYFFLEILGNGALRYQFEDRDDDNDFDITEPTPITPRPGNQWYHVAITWDYTIVDSSNNPNFQIFVDGVMVANTINARNSNNIDGQPNYQRVHFGDNASNYNYVPDASANGTIDEMRLYNRILTSAEIVTASGETHPCAGQAIVRYQFEEPLWNGTPDEIKDDSGFNYDAVQVGNVNPVPYTSTCQAADFDQDDASPTGIIAIATPMDIDRDIGNEGSIMMWLKSRRDWGSFTAERNIFDASRNPREFYASVLPTGEVKFVVTDASNNVFVLTSSALSATTDDWVHVAFTWNFTSQQLALYVDGVLADSSPGAGVFNIADLPTLYLGDSQNSRASGSNNSWYGLMEDARIYNYARTVTEVNADITDFSPCVELLNHFDIDEWDNANSAATAANAINCAAEPIRITAKLADNSTANTFTGTVRLEARDTTTNNLVGAWSSPKASFTNLGTGEAQIDFVLADNGILGSAGDLTLAITEPATVTIQAIFAAVNETTGSATAGDDPDFTFAQSGFIVTDTLNGSAVSSVDIIAGTQSQNLFLKAITTDPTTGVCTGLFSSDVAVEMGTQCVNPGSCANGQQIDFVQTLISALPNPENNSGASVADITTAFGADSTATFRVNSPDVGVQDHTFTYRLNGPTSTAGETLTTSIRYYARPNSIAITSRRNSSNQELDPALTNTAIAGENFLVTISGFNAANATYPSFNRIDFDASTVAMDFYPINWTDSLVAPIGGVAGTLAGGNNWNATGNSLETTMSYSEISELQIAGTLNDFWNGASGVFNYNLSAINIATLVPSYMRVASQTTATWSSPLSSFYQGMTSSIIGYSIDLQAMSAQNTVIENWDNTNPSFNTATNALQKESGSSAVGGALTSELSWTLNDTVDDDVVTLDATLSNVVWSQRLTGVDANDVSPTISGFELAQSAITSVSGLCIQTNATAACSTGTIAVDTNDETLYVARIRAPEQVDASSSEANIPVTLEVMTGWDGATSEPTFTVNNNENELGLVAGEITGLQHTNGTTCTIAGCPMATTSLTPLQLYNLFDSDNELANGSGFLQYSPAAAPLSGILEASLVVPSWLHWDWDGDGIAEAPATMMLFGDYQGKAPILFIRPGFR